MDLDERGNLLTEFLMIFVSTGGRVATVAVKLVLPFLFTLIMGTDIHLDVSDLHALRRSMIVEYAN